MAQVAEGVSTAGAVIALAEKYHVKMPVLTAVARIIDNELTPKKAVLELMSLPQVLASSSVTILIRYLTSFSPFLLDLHHSTKSLSSN